jgi:hypothetical protein
MQAKHKGARKINGVQDALAFCTHQFHVVRWLSVEPLPTPDMDRPHWNPVTCRLTFSGKLVRQLAKRARNCIAVLNAFEEEGWPACIDDPLRGGEKETSRLGA